jgi:NADPH:quinone reductase-like Zn-dependent oxidoreductase
MSVHGRKSDERGSWHEYRLWHECELARRLSQVAALMGGLGCTINGSYAEYTRAPVSNVALIESDLSWAELAAIPETYATAWTCLFRNLEIK